MLYRVGVCCYCDTLWLDSFMPRPSILGEDRKCLKWCHKCNRKCDSALIIWWVVVTKRLNMGKPENTFAHKWWSTYILVGSTQVTLDPVLRSCDELVGGKSTQPQAERTPACYEASRNSSPSVISCLLFCWTPPEATACSAVVSVDGST